MTPVAGEYKVKGNVRELIVKVGEPLPQGILVACWKLNPKPYGEGTICIHYRVEK